MLEHVQDDRRAIAEFYRTLKDEGWAILLVPIGATITYEDPSIVDPMERKRAFGQADHVRIYGPDYVDRLLAGGFSVQQVEVSDLCTEEEAIWMGLTGASGSIFHCTKRIPEQDSAGGR